MFNKDSKSHVITLCLFYNKCARQITTATVLCGEPILYALDAGSFSKQLS